MSADNALFQCTNIRLGQLQANGIRVAGMNNFIAIEDILDKTGIFPGKGFRQSRHTAPM